MRQTLAIFIDAYRELNSRKLFWISMALSLVVVLAFAFIGINEKGLTIFGRPYPALFNTTLMSKEAFYKLMFSRLGVQWWLGLFATLLALVTTAGLIPDLIASGSIDLTLSKPLGRLRLFLTKFTAGLLCTALQVFVFTLAAFFVLGIRAGSWEPGLFWAVPLMVLFFSFLFSICVLLGMITRSTVASLLITLLVWFVIFGINTAERGALAFLIFQNERVERVESTIKDLQTQIENSQPEQAPKFSVTKFLGNDLPQRLERQKALQATYQSDRASAKTWYSVFFGVKTILPKTGETIEVLERMLLSQADIQGMKVNQSFDMNDNESNPDAPRILESEVRYNFENQIRSRSLWWIIGTSLGFEAVMLGIAGWIFSRRDF